MRHARKRAATEHHCQPQGRERHREACAERHDEEQAQRHLVLGDRAEQHHQRRRAGEQPGCGAHRDQSLPGNAIGDVVLMVMAMPVVVIVVVMVVRVRVRVGVNVTKARSQDSDPDDHHEQPGDQRQPGL